MKHRVLDSLEELLDPAFLSEAAGQRVTGVSRRRLGADFAHSGSELHLVECETSAPGAAGVGPAEGSPVAGGSPAGPGDAADGPRFVLKRLALEWDWLMRMTEDTLCRSVALWEEGLFDRLPPELDACVVGAARDGEGWAILMKDVGPYLVTDRRFTVDQNRLFLEAMAGMHAEFFEDPAPQQLDVGLSEIRHVFEMFAPRTALRKDAGSGDILRKIMEGWKTVRTVCPTDVIDAVESLLEDPTPLVDALSQYPRTLVHGDFRHSNLAALPGNAVLGATGAGGEAPAGASAGPASAAAAGAPAPTPAPGRVGLLDWQLAVYAPPAVELGRYIGANSPFLPGSKEAILEYYRNALAKRLGSRFSDEWWVPQLELGMLGGFVQDGWAIALKATTWHVGAAYREHWMADLEWWTEKVRAGARWLR